MVGSLRKDYELLTDTMVPKPQNVQAVMGKTSVPTSAPKGLGDLMAPASNSDGGAPAPMAGGGGGAPAPDFEAKVKRNESFLSNPDIQNSLLDFAIQVMSPGLTTEEQQKKRQLDLQEQNMLFDNKMAQANYGLAAESLKLNQMETRDKLVKSRMAQQQLSRRQQLFDGISNGGKLADMATDDLTDLAGELMSMGDDEGAKVAIQMADNRRQANSTPDLIEYRTAVNDGSFVGGFNKYLQQKIKAGVPPSPTSGIDPKMQEAGLKAHDDADMLDGQIQELQATRELVKKTSTGALTPLTLPLRSAMKQIGIDFGDKNEGDQIDLQQSLRAQQGQLALRMRNPASGFGLPGAASDNDLKFLKEIVGSLANTPDANEAILTVMIGKQRRSAELARLKGDYIFNNGTLKGWSDEKKKYIDDHSFLTDDEKAYLERMGNPMKSAPGIPEAPAKNDTLPAVAPDNLTAKQKERWPYASEKLKKHWMGQ